MATGAEFYDPDGRVLFNTTNPPYIYLGKVGLTANSGSPITSDAYNRDNLAPNLTNAEFNRVVVPAGTLFMAVAGDKYPTAVAASQSAQDGQWYGYFNSQRTGTGTLYCFGRHPGTSVTNQGLEFYDNSGRVIFDVFRKPMRIVPGTNGNYTTIPAGKAYAVLYQQYEIGIGNVFVGGSSQGNRSYIRYYTGAGWTDGSQAGVSRFNSDITQYAAGDPNDYTIMRTGQALFVDVTGY